MNSRSSSATVKSLEDPVTDNVRSNRKPSLGNPYRVETNWGNGASVTVQGLVRERRNAITEVHLHLELPKDPPRAIRVPITVRHRALRTLLAKKGIYADQGQLERILNLFYRANYAAERVGGFLAKYEGLAVFVLNDAGGLVVDHEELFDLFPS